MGGPARTRWSSKIHVYLPLLTTDSLLLLVCIVVLIVHFFFRFVRFVTFRRVLDAKMQEATRMGVTLKTKGEESSKYSLILCKLSLCIF